MFGLKLKDVPTDEIDAQALVRLVRPARRRATTSATRR